MNRILTFSLILLFLLPWSSSADEPSDEEKRISAIQQAIKSTVKVEIGLVEHGSGFFITENMILTNAHVADTYKYDIEKSDGSMCRAKLFYREEGLDLALIESDCTGTPLELADSYVVGQTVLAVGNPSIYDFVVSKGIVSGQEWGMILFDAPVYPGNSGGPLVGLTGEVIGVVKARDKSLYSIGVAISAKEVNRFLNRAR